jgi:3-oxoacyl-[acyl-carrier protein] reductase
MDLQLKGKVAIVGGASKGLGRACAQALAEEGVNVALCSRSKPDIEKAAKEIRDGTGTDAMAFSGDLDKAETIHDLVAATVARYGRLDILVNNSGGPPLAYAQTATEEQWGTAVQRSLLFFARMSREALPHLKKAAVGGSSTSWRAPSTSPFPISRSPARRGWAWSRSPRASPTK